LRVYTTRCIHEEVCHTSTYMRAIVVGITVFTLAFVCMLTLSQPVVEGKPWPSLTWDFNLMVGLTISLLISFFGALYVYKFGEYEPPYP